MSETAVAPKKTFSSALGWLAAGVGLIFCAWLLPINLKSVSPALLHEAGQGTPKLVTFGRELVDSEKLGPATLVLATVEAAKDPGAPALAAALQGLTAHQPELVAWGGWDPFLDPLFNVRDSDSARSSTPVMTFFLPAKARNTLRDYLANSRSMGVQAILKTHETMATGRFVPASQPGGQPLDAVILLCALLYQGEHFSPSLQRELRGLAQQAAGKNELGELEPFYADLLSLSQRLNWVQLSELLRRTNDTRTTGEYAHLARVAPDQLALIYSAALFSGSADRVAIYLIQFGKAGLEDLRQAINHGQGALKLLLGRQVPISRLPGPDLGAAAELSLLHPVIALIVKWLGFLVGAICLLRGIDQAFFTPTAGFGPALPHLQGNVLAVLLAGLLVVITEPYLLKAAPPSEFELHLSLPVLVTFSQLPPAASVKKSLNMDTSTLISIAFFATLQTIMYVICLMKIRDVSRLALPPLVKLKLMENEENLFDGGLYVGIGGTATALVLQVLGVIEPNLLAAYSSNLFGITCVALVKIRHVRPYKRQLILQTQEEARVMAA